MKQKIIALLLLCLCCNTVLAANIAASTDRAAIGINDSFTLTYEATGSVSGDPDFSVLQQSFEIVNSTQSSSVNIINGEVSRKKVWTLKLFPRRSGTLTIPAINFGKDQSPELQINVGGSVKRKSNSGNTKSKPGGAATNGQDFIVKVDATPKKAHVQSQISLVVRLYLGRNISSGNLSIPKLSDPNAIIERFGEDANYETSLNNRRYNVVERRYTIYPQSPGKLTIEPVRFDGKPRGRTGSLFDPFGSGLFGSPLGKRQNNNPVRVMSKPITIDVLPIPNTFTGQQWLPAQELKLTEEWAPNPPVFKVGEPVTRTLTVSANGLAATLLPQLHNESAGGFKQYPDKPILQDKKLTDTILGIRSEKIALIPTQPGKFTLPAIEIPWWNIQTNQQEIARLPAREITVTGAATGTAPTAPAPQSTPATEPQVDENISDNAPTTATPASQQQIWPWVTLAIAIAWILTLVAWWLRGRKTPQPATTKTPVQEQTAIHSLEKKLKTACENNDKQATKTALLDWAAAYWPDNPPRSIGAVAEQAGGELGEQVTALNTALYREPGKDWNGHALWAAFQNFKKTDASTSNDDRATLQPLHKI